MNPEIQGRCASSAAAGMAVWSVNAGGIQGHVARVEKRGSWGIPGTTCTSISISLSLAVLDTATVRWGQTDRHRSILEAHLGLGFHMLLPFLSLMGHLR